VTNAESENINKNTKARTITSPKNYKCYFITDNATTLFNKDKSNNFQKIFQQESKTKEH